MGAVTFPRLIHYSGAPLGALYSVPQFEQRLHMKPRGLWVSCEGEDDWKSWCEDEHFHLECLRFATEIRLRGDANILHITNIFELDDFTSKHAQGYELSGRDFHTVAWPNVAAEYQGIIIHPYLWERRLSEHTLWYYGWDCAAGCIWDAKAIEQAVPQEN